MSRKINYRFTYNNYTADGEENLKKWLIENCKYAVFGHEVAPTTGTPHLQGFMSLHKHQTIKTLQNKFKKLDIGLALLGADASAEANRLYATKDKNNIFTCGEITDCGKGSRTDLKRVAEKILDNQPVKKIVREELVEFIKYHSGIEKACYYIEEDNIPEVRDLTVTLLYGDAGSGKTRAVIEFAKKNNLSTYFVPNPNSGSLWFDGYCRHDILIIDDFKSWIRYHDLLRILDCYKLALPRKGGFVWAYYKYVFITSNVPWDKWYNPDNIDGFTKDALDRRIHNIIAYYGKYPDVDLVQERVNKDPVS